MKNPINFLAAAIFISCTVSAQQLARQVVASGGGQYEGASFSVYNTVGQTAFATFTTTDVILFQGFQQAFLSDLTLITEDANRTEWNVYPNPCTDRLIFSIENEKATQMRVEIFDAHGGMVYSTEAVRPIVEINSNILLPGYYFYKCSSQSGGQLLQQNGKFIKL